ncbi:hypothetical protein IW262DRAFT_1464684 [Armillaria fumosa]|nr:hypothetical protein IW262DRAFT_1464684 [Armillaria fumosa]
MFQWSLLFFFSLLALAMATHTRDHWPSRPIVCGNNTYTRSDVEWAIEVGAFRSLPAVGDEFHYPRKVNNVNGLPSRCLRDRNATIFAFPILPNQQYVNGNPGPDHVIYTVDENKPECCAVITYSDGMSSNPFVLCKGS